MENSEDIQRIDYDIRGRRLVLENQDLKVCIQFKGDTMEDVVSKNRRLVLEKELIQLFQRATRTDPEFREHMDKMFGALFMRDIPPGKWKRQADYLL